MWNIIGDKHVTSNEIVILEQIFAVVDTKYNSSGYIERSTDPVDARASLLRLTPDGKDALNRLTEARHEWLREILAEFQPADRAQFADLLERFVTRMIAASG